MPATAPQTEGQQTDGQHISVAVQTQAAPDSPTGMDVYITQSAKQCPLNSPRSAWRCCGYFTLICWVIYSVIGAALSFDHYFNDLNEADDFEICPEKYGSGFTTGSCCAFYSEDDFAYVPGTCSTLRTAAIISGVNKILAAIAGIVGVLGMARMVATLLYVPMAYSVVSLLLELVVAVLLSTSWFFRYVIWLYRMVVFVPVYQNWKIIKAFNPFVAKSAAVAGIDAYMEKNAKRCPWKFCTCRHFGFCILICWVIFGLIGAAVSLYAFSDGLFDGVTEHCCKGNGYCGDCCALEEYYAAGSCNSLQTAIFLSGVSSIFAIMGGVAGLLGMTHMVAALLLVPMCHLVLSLLLDIVVIALLWWGRKVYLIAPFLGVSISILFFLPFYRNWKLIKTFKPRGV